VSQRSLLVDTDFEVDKKLIEVDYLGTVAITRRYYHLFRIEKDIL
jgi:hypothetical protein